jgi:hypothetical protein
MPKSGLQARSPPQVSPAQHSSSSPPQGKQVPSKQAASAPHEPPAQQDSPTSPQATQTLPSPQIRSAPQVFPAQHVSPASPQALQDPVAASHVNPVEQAPLAQQG